MMYVYYIVLYSINFMNYSVSFNFKIFWVSLKNCYEGVNYKTFTFHMTLTQSGNWP